VTLTTGSSRPRLPQQPGAAVPHASRPPGSVRLLRLGGVFVASSAVGLVFAVVQLSLQAARTVVYPARQLPQTTPAAYGMPFERVEFPSYDGTSLRGWYIPRGPSAIVLAHGHGGAKQDMLDHAVYLQAAGHSVLMFDFRAAGESDGAHSTLGYLEWQDLVGAARFLASRPDVDGHRLGLLGVSAGAAAALQLGQDARHFKAVVADSSFATADTLVGRFDRWFRLPAWPFSVSVPWAIHHYVGIVPSAVAPVKEIPRISPTPVLIIHGGSDIGIPPEDAYRLYEAAREPKELWVIATAAHAGGHGVATAEYEARVLGFFGRHLAGS